ncbi:MAG: ubiquinone biosynthesis protein, partial [Opitutia bacterium Tous-C10FEB]
MPDPKAVNTMFARIAGRYDIANHLLSGGIDYWWRQRLVRAVYDSHAASVLDLATGSGDVVFALADGLAPGVTLLGMDFCQPMLDEAVKKREENHRWTHIEFRLGDGMALPLPDASFEAITISFGLRNMVNR